MTTKTQRRQAADKTAGRRRVGIYIRISKDRENEVSTAVQEKDGRAYVAMKSWDVVEVYVDQGLSASKPNVVRPAYQRLLADVDAGALDVVLIWKLDRLGRSVIELNRVAEQLRDRGVDLVSLHDSIDTSTPGGRFMFTVLAALAQLESEQISLRVTAANGHRALVNRRPHAGGRTFGYAPGGEQIVDDEAALLREAADRLLAGETRSDVAKDWNARGVRTVNGKQWWPANLGRAVTSPHVAGLRTHRDTIVAGDWPAIITPEIRDQLLAIVGDRRNGAEPRRYERGLLTGLLFCALCGRRLRRTGHRRGDRYGCVTDNGTGCGRIHVMCRSIETDLRTVVFDALVDPAFRAAIRSGRAYQDVERLTSEVNDIQTALDEVAAEFGARRITVGEWRAAREPLAEALEAAQTELDGATTGAAPGLDDDVPDTIDGLEVWWKHAPFDAQRALLHAALLRVDVGPPTRPGPYDPARIRPGVGNITMRA